MAVEFYKNTNNEVELRINAEIMTNDDKRYFSWYGFDGVCPKDVTEVLKQLKNEPLKVIINSPGGSVWCASEIYHALKSYQGKVIVEIAGLAASCASWIAMAGDMIKASPTAVIMIHDPSTVAAGTRTDMQRAVSMLDETKDSIVNAYVKRTNKSRAEIEQMMSDETWMSANKALEVGFIDEILFDEADEQPLITNSVADSLIGAYKMSFERLRHETEPEEGAQNTAQLKALAFIEIEKNRF